MKRPPHATSPIVNLSLSPKPRVFDKMQRYSRTGTNLGSQGYPRLVQSTQTTTPSTAPSQSPKNRLSQATKTLFQQPTTTFPSPARSFQTPESSSKTQHKSPSNFPPKRRAVPPVKNSKHHSPHHRSFTPSPMKQGAQKLSPYQRSIRSPVENHISPSCLLKKKESGAVRALPLASEVPHVPGSSSQDCIEKTIPRLVY